MLDRVRRNPLALTAVAIALIAALALVWWTVSPLFIRTTLVEGQNISVPSATQPAGASASDDAGIAGSGDNMDKPADAMMEPTPEAMMDKPAESGGMMEKDTPEAMAEPTKEAGMMDKPADTMMEPTPEAMMEAAPDAMMPEATPEAMMDKPADSMMDKGPAVLGTGNFDRKDDVHYANGQAILARQEDGAVVLRLQDLDAANGPDLYVYVSENPDPKNSDELQQGEHNLGSLKATNGSFSYTLDASIDPAKIKSVVIYCRAFSVIFSTATLQAPQGQ
jgi:hypothetical protein